MFFHLFLPLFFLFNTLNACQYQSCQQKVKDAHLLHKKFLTIAIKKNVNLIYSATPPNAKILKYDPFLSLYLVEQKDNFLYPFHINLLQTKKIACVADKKSVEGKIVQKQVGLNTLATFSTPLNAPNILATSCCFLEGIVGFHGIIQKEYLQHFIENKGVLYSDVGIRVMQKGKQVIVSASNPYIKTNRFKNGDILLTHNGKKVKDAAVLMQEILFSKLGDIHHFTFKRKNKILHLKIKSFQRYGGGVISDTFLEAKGIYFDKKLTIIKLDRSLQIKGVELGDKLIQVNGIGVKNQKELRKYISNFHEFSSLLISRNGFEFFVNTK